MRRLLIIFLILFSLQNAFANQVDSSIHFFDSVQITVSKIQGHSQLNECVTLTPISWVDSSVILCYAIVYNGHNRSLQNVLFPNYKVSFLHPMGGFHPRGICIASRHGNTQHFKRGGYYVYMYTFKFDIGYLGGAKIIIPPFAGNSQYEYLIKEKKY